MGSMNLDLPVVGETPGTTWATMLNTALSPNIEEHDHSTGKGVYVKTTGAGSVGINVNGDMNFQDIDPLSPGFNAYNRPINLKSIQLIAGTAAGTYPVTSNLNVYCDDQNLFFRDGSGTEIQLTTSGGVPGSDQYGFQNDYDAFAPSMGYARYDAAIKEFDFASDAGSSTDAILTCVGVTNTGGVAAGYNWGPTVLGLSVLDDAGSVRIGKLESILAPSAVDYTYPSLWYVEVAPAGPGHITDAQNGFRIQGTLLAPSGDSADGPQHLDLTATAVNTGLNSYWADPNFPTVPLTPQISADDGVIAYWGNPKPTSTQTDLFITGSYDQRLGRFYDGIKLKGGGDVDIHIANGAPLSEFALRGGATNDLTWSWYNGLSVSLVEMVRGGSTNDTFNIIQKGTGDLRLQTDGDVALAITSSQTTTLHGDLYVNGAPLTNKIILGNGSAVSCGIEVGSSRTGSETSFIDFTTETTTGDFDARIRRLTVAGGGELLVQNNGTGNTVLRVGDPAAAVETQRETFAGAGFLGGAIGFDNLETDPTELKTGGSDPNVACYGAATAIQNSQNTILARGTFHYDSLGSYPNRYSFGANSWNIASVVETGTTDGQIVVTMSVAPLTPAPALPDVTYQVTVEHAGFGTSSGRIGMAKMGSSAAEIEVMLISDAGSKMGATFFLTVIGPPD